MELWIRSQDKESLIQVDCLCIEKNEIDKGKYIYSSFDIVQGCITLGTYKTKERALEVLDEIEGLLLLKKGLKLTADAVYSVENNLAIYEMPKE